MKIAIKNESSNPNPEYKTSGSAGMDLMAFLSESVVVRSGERRLVPTGIRIGLPEGYEAQVRPRSGKCLKEGLDVMIGTIDADYRGMIGVIVHNISDCDIVISNGERIAQLVIAQVTRAEWDDVDSLPETERGEGGFGHTGA